MQQRREWREKSGGVLKEVEDVEEVNEVEELTAEVWEIEVIEELGSGGDGTNSELEVAGPGVLGTGSAEIPPGAGVIAAPLFSIDGAA